MQTLLSVIHKWVWKHPRRRALNLIRFAEVEAHGGRDLIRAAEVTTDPLLRRLFLKHALDEQRHAEIFRARGLALLGALPPSQRSSAKLDWIAPGERGLDYLRVENEADAALLAFLHLSEKAAARDFQHYIAALQSDPETRAVFEKILHDEAFHMKYTHVQLVRVAPKAHRELLWRARLGRLWKAYLRVAAWLAGITGEVVLTLQYFVILPPFALMARRADRREPPGWVPVGAERNGGLGRQY
jgi:rubrerythrin